MDTEKDRIYTDRASGMLRTPNPPIHNIKELKSPFLDDAVRGESWRSSIRENPAFRPRPSA
jgi:hypothetical protein